MNLLDAIDEYIDMKHRCGYAFLGGEKSLRSFCLRLGDVNLEQITIEVVKDYLDESIDSLVHWRVKYGILFYFFLYWRDRGQMHSLLMPIKRRRVREPFVPYIFTKHQIREILRCTHTFCDSRDHIDPQTMKMFLVLLYGTGSFSGEVLQLRTDDPDLDKCTIRFRGAGARWREIPIGASLVKVLGSYMNWRHRRGYQSPILLVTKFDREIRLATAASHFEKAAPQNWHSQVRWIVLSASSN